MINYRNKIRQSFFWMNHVYNEKERNSPEITACFKKMTLTANKLTAIINTLQGGVK
jgi:hypothetical protein